MPEGRRFFWLKLRTDFFDSLPMKRLRKISGGETFTIIYLKLLIRAINTDGLIEHKGICESFAEELALDLDEREDDVKLALAYLVRTGLAETDSETWFSFPYAEMNVGTEAESTERSRRCRERKRALQGNVHATLMQRSCNADKEVDGEIYTPPLPPAGESCVRVPSVMHRPDAFAAIWKRYPADWRGNPQSVAKAWRQLAPDDQTIQWINYALDCKLRSDAWRRGIGIPWLTTFLKTAGWESEDEPP